MNPKRVAFVPAFVSVCLASVLNSSVSEEGGVSEVLAQTPPVEAARDLRWRTTPEPPPIDLSGVAAGECLWRRDGELYPMPVLATEVTLEVTGVLARGTVRQSFENPTTEVIEAIYVFPLPEGAAVHAMEMRIGERRIVSVVKERTEAKRTYESAKRKGKKAALLESERPNLFTTSVANINPGERIHVTLEYLEELRWEAGRFRLVFPMTFTPRYLPRPQLASADVPGLPPGGIVEDGPRVTPPFLKPPGEAIPEAELVVTLRPGIPIESVRSSSHIIEVIEQGSDWLVTSPSGSFRADCDFVLEWRATPGAEPRSAVFVEGVGDERYALVMIVPPHPDAASTAPGLPTETLFIIDVSGSMDGPSIRQARSALLTALDRQEPGDRFNLLAFNEYYWSFREAFVDATPRALEDARQWVRGLHAGGGTEIHAALSHGLFLTGDRDDDRVRRIVFLTDGAVGNEDRVLETIHRGLHFTRLHAIGIGYSPNRFLMKKMASFGRGLCEFVRSDDPAENPIDAFLTRIDRPVMSDLEIDWAGANPDDVYPARLPDLHSGEPLFVSAKLGAGTSTSLTLRGRRPSGRVETLFSLRTNAPSHSGVGIRWGRHKVGSLMDDLRRGTTDPDLVRHAVIEVAREFDLVTKFTSLVAVEEVVSSEGPAELVRVPNVLPRGSRLLAGELPVGGTDDRFRMFLGLLALSVGVALALIARPHHAGQ